MIPLWFVKIAIIFIFGVPLLAGLLIFLIAAMILDYEDKQKGGQDNGEAQELHA